MVSNPRQVLRYKPLQPHLKEIRLFRLKPRNYRPSSCPWFLVNVAIFGELEHVSRDDSVMYTALSYAWGDGVRNRIGVGQEELYISTNLEDALLQLQDDNEDVLLWADQICINQQDKEERSEQVQQMREIYAEAERTVAWLGLAADESDLAINLLSKMSRGIGEEEELDLSRITDPVRLAIISTAFDRLCKRSYWHRLWVIQEFAVARQVDVMCGASSIPSHKLHYVLDAFNRVPGYIFDSDEYNLKRTDTNSEEVKTANAVFKDLRSATKSSLENIVYHRHAYQWVQQKGMSLFHILTSTLVSGPKYDPPQCSEPRDSIFALLGLTDDATEFSEFPNYTISCKDVYTKTTIRLLEQGHIGFLSYCQFPMDKQIGVPSWVPDWRLKICRPSIRSLLTRDGPFSASGKSVLRQMVSHRDSHLLTLRGIRVDTVEEFGSVWVPEQMKGSRPQQESALQYLAEIRAFVAQSPRISPGGEDFHASRIAVADFHGSANIPQLWERAHTGCLQLLGESKLEVFYERSLNAVHSVRPFISTSGFVGLAPLRVQVGDVVCILLGGDVPYLLRKCGESYILVGEAYVHGIMYGEHTAGSPNVEDFTLK
ncbi:HET-domain-containing protein [Mytilinidion resinicola]|uniref:HET-domain-containing protein n=1 Tax=Mytilinidion resinicola TaxID=574789 RepID=A0A6A6YQL7_9PEZI|nr:HET-domain-containing protein [Mytilinidion resinicola]KAF2810809.1 HET-domain-containing protein [Mytilinidion resinicola]